MGADGKPGPGEVSAFSIHSRTGKLTEINRVQSRGGQPCHLCTDKTGKMVMVANWYTGSVASFPIERSGALGESAGFFQQEGARSGPTVPGPQTSHCHSASPRTPSKRTLGLCGE
jgi:6-phosphogluconolactonase